MSVERAYIFPNILPDNGLIFPLAQFFDQIVLLRPVEDDLPDTDTPFSVETADQQGRGGCINFSCPAPLAEDRERFLILLQDIRSRPEDYAGHLGNLSAGLGHMIRPNEQEKSIMDTLLHQTGIGAGSRDNTPEPGKGQEKNASSVLLWQARLLLKLGESLDQNQAEIRRDLDRMTRQQEELFRELRKERKEEEGEPPGLAFPLFDTDNELSLKQQRLRLKAWSRLFALSPDQFETTAFISSSPDTVEALLKHYRQEHTKTAKQLLSLPLPAFFDEDDEALLCRDRFQEEASELIATIRAGLTASDEKVFLEESREVWGDMLERHYPAAEHRRCTLTLYFLPEITPQRLFLETFAPHDDLAAREVVEATEAGTLLGILMR
ncbi:MAG: hypothetical protein QTN59_05650 [Candidatus Electrothrix communis]|nr:MAG: hypothetical protein QTN59_05650 [Candidatus Electrothrix communis]